MGGSVCDRYVVFCCWKVWWPYASVFYFTFTIHTFTPISFITFAVANLHIFTAACTVGGTEPPWGAEPRFKLGPAFCKPINYCLSYAAPCLNYAANFWSTRHPNCVTLHPSELRCTLTELSCTLIEPRCILLTTLHPNCATLHPSELRCTLLSYAAP
jgi:hypothetical protein